jgi:hypothetical protein
MMSQDPNWENPYAGGQEAANSLENQPTSAPHTLGILNIVFSIILLLCIACYGTQIIAQGMLGSTFGANQPQFQQAIEQERQKQLDRLDESIENADTDEKADQLRAQRDALEKTPLPKLPDMSNMVGMKEPGVFATYLFDCLSGFLLNVLMLISGVGLLKYQSWARKMAIWVAGLKVIRLMILCALGAAILAPAVSNGFGEFIHQTVQMNPQGAPPQDMKVEQLKTAYYWMIIVWGVLVLVFGSIYPIISLWKLSQANVIAACQKKPAASHTF